MPNQAGFLLDLLKLCRRTRQAGWQRVAKKRVAASQAVAQALHKYILSVRRVFEKTYFRSSDWGLVCHPPNAATRLTWR